jgi:rare lipoprotein A (peptidoglycan hydrolase)
VRFRGDRLNAAASRSLGGRVYVYRPSQASWYGPGLYGNGLACGGRLGPGTLGVANRTLPCGTRVTLRYRGRSVTVPVIDRGPFHATREWDLTGATKARLHFPDTGVVWTTR